MSAPAESTPSIARWLDGHRHEVIDLAGVGIALWLVGRFVAPIPVPPAAYLAALILAALMPGPAASPAPPRPGRWLRAVAAALMIGGLLRIWFGLPWAILAFAPLWFAVMLAGRIAAGNFTAAMRRARRGLAAAWSGVAIAWGWVTRRDGRDERRIFTAAAPGAILGLAGYYYPGFWSRPMAVRPHVVVLCWGLAGLAASRVALRLIGRRWEGRQKRAEILRWILVGAAGLWLMRGFAQFTLHGVEDARWYGTVLADMLAQARAGIFPVWAGQTEYQFNGSINPLRIAPAFQYAGALLDLLTGRSLGVFALQNLLLTLVGLAGILSAYASLAAVAPRARWLAAGWSVLYLACPGVLGLAYNGDLFMSWMLLPWVPWVWLATVNSFRDGGSRNSLLLLGAALALCWWAHPPIAFWMILLAGIAQLVRWATQGVRGIAWRNCAMGAAFFCVIAAYPIASFLIFPPEAGSKADLLGSSAFTIADYLKSKELFPASYLPMSPLGREHGDFQLGYGLWALLLVGLGRFRSIRRAEARTLLAFAAGLILLLAPIPWLNLALWRALPQLVRNMTGNWVVSRLYLLLAGTAIFGVAAAADSLAAGARGRKLLQIVTILAGGWSLGEGAKFAAGSRFWRRPEQTAADFLRPENVRLYGYSYVFFPRMPPRFTYGVTDPRIENRLLAADGLQVIGDNLAAARASGRVAAAGEFVSPPPGGPGGLVLNRSFHLAAGKHYLLEFEFAAPDRARGVLKLEGRTIFCVYGLPDYGGERSFGAGGAHSRLLPLSSGEGDDLAVSFFPEPPPSGGSALPFASIRLISYDPADLPVQVRSWMPYQARVSSGSPAWVETPRMFQSAYAAQVNGRPAPTRKTPDGLAAIRVPAGISEVKLKFRPPLGLAALFWLSLAGLAACGVCGVAALGGRRPDRPSPAP